MELNQNLPAVFVGGGVLPMYTNAYSADVPLVPLVPEVPVVPLVPEVPDVPVSNPLGPTGP